MKGYKTSMFNFVSDSEKGDGVIIFNSFMGIGSVIDVSPDKATKIRRWLCLGDINDNEAEDPDFRILCDRGFFVNNKIDEEAKRSAAIYSFVADSKLRLLIDTTSACNFRCLYCADDFNDCKTMTKDVQQGVVEFVRKNISKYSEVRVDWFGGEPLIGYSVIENISCRLIEICERARKKYSATITTNGYLLNSDMINRLLKLRVFSYTITLDGLKETHDQLRVTESGGESWKIIYDNLCFIRDNVRNRFLRIVLRTNVTKNILESIEKYYCFMDNEFGADSRFMLLFRVAGDWGGNRVKEIRENLIEEKKLIEVYKRVAAVSGRLKCAGNYFYLNPGGRACRSSKINRYAIGVDGKVSKCENVSDINAIGVIYRDGRVDIDYDEEAAWTCGHRNKCSKECLECPLSMLCFLSPCPAAYVQNRIQPCNTKEEVRELLKLLCESGEVKRL